jgi:hypothetical protein
MMSADEYAGNVEKVSGEPMPQTCTICRHEGRQDTDRALLDGESFWNIASRTGTSTTALHRHKTQHIPRSLALAKETVEQVQAGTLFERLRSAGRVTDEILNEARSTKNHVIALQAIGPIERQIELEARLLGERDDSTKVAFGMRMAPAGPDLSGLTPGQLFEEQRILREAMQQIEAVRTGTSQPVLIEAAMGAVEAIEG